MVATSRCVAGRSGHSGVEEVGGRPTRNPVSGSRTASVYSMGSTPGAMLAIAALTVASRRTVTDTFAPARTAAPMVGEP